MNGRDFDEANSLVYFTFVGTGTYLVFWQILIVVLLIALIIAAIVVCISTLFKNLPVDMD
jgi:polyferredoxin